MLDPNFLENATEKESYLTEELWKTHLEYTPKTQAEALCHKYLDGLNPMFDREPVKVLEELTTILEQL